MAETAIVEPTMSTTPRVFLAGAQGQKRQNRHRMTRGTTECESMCQAACTFSATKGHA